MRPEKIFYVGSHPCQGYRKISYNGWDWGLLSTGSLKFRELGPDGANGEMRWLASGIGVALLVGCLATVNAQTTKTITIRDACDPDSFNMVAGSTICIPGHHGTTLFEDFVAELTADQIVGAWRFNPLVHATEGTFTL